MTEGIDSFKTRAKRFNAFGKIQGMCNGFIAQIRMDILRVKIVRSKIVSKRSGVRNGNTIRKDRNFMLYRKIITSMSKTIDDGLTQSINRNLGNLVPVDSVTRRFYAPANIFYYIFYSLFQIILFRFPLFRDQHLRHDERDRDRGMVVDDDALARVFRLRVHLIIEDDALVDRLLLGTSRGGLFRI